MSFKWFCVWLFGMMAAYTVGNETYSRLVYRVVSDATDAADTAGSREAGHTLRNLAQDVRTEKYRNLFGKSDVMEAHRLNPSGKY